MAVAINRYDLFGNLRFLPAYYYIPKAMLQNSGQALSSIPRNPRILIRDRQALAVIKSSLFELLIVDAFAYMVHPFMGLGVKREIYSGYEASWLFSHMPLIWIRELEREGILPTPEDLLRGEGVDFEFGYMSELEISEVFQWLVPQAMERNGVTPILEAQAEHRCFEDFDYRYSRQKVDFYRKWYHTRTRHPQISLESFRERYAESHSGQEWDVPDESQEMEERVLSQIHVDAFLATLHEKDRAIVELRMEGITLEEIAKRLGYQNHSGVLKRLRRIGEAYKRFKDKGEQA